MAVAVTLVVMAVTPDAMTQPSPHHALLAAMDVEQHVVVMQLLLDAHHAIILAQMHVKHGVKMIVTINAQKTVTLIVVRVVDMTVMDHVKVFVMEVVLMAAAIQLRVQDVTHVQQHVMQFVLLVAKEPVETLVKMERQQFLLDNFLTCFFSYEYKTRKQRTPITQAVLQKSRKKCAAPLGNNSFV